MRYIIMKTIGIRILVILIGIFILFRAETPLMRVLV